MRRFHLAFRVNDLSTTKLFYCKYLNCKEGRSSDNWLDFDFFGNQLSAHLLAKTELISLSKVEGKEVTIPHFGVILEKQEWNELIKRLESFNINLMNEPSIRFLNKEEEQGTFFIKDPSDNVLEFKYFKNQNNIF